MRSAIATVRTIAGMLVLTLGMVFVVLAVYVGGSSMSRALLTAFGKVMEKRQ